MLIPFIFAALALIQDRPEAIIIGVAVDPQTNEELGRFKAPVVVVDETGQVWLYDPATKDAKPIKRGMRIILLPQRVIDPRTMADINL